jgi:flagellar protein FliO/FliZ
MNSLFGIELPTAVNFVIAFVVVLLLIGLAAWLVRRFGATRLDAARGRQPRLAVVDSSPVDSRRKLVIIRRDNIEHLLMIGGPTDVVVETNIVRATAAARDAAPTRDAAPARNGNGDHAPRSLLADPNQWPLPAEAMPAPVVVPPARPVVAPRPVADDKWHAPSEPIATPPAPPRAVRPADTLAGLAAELSQPASPARGPQGEPTTAAPSAVSATVAPPITPTDQSLAEMAQRLEAALRRPAPPKMAVDGGARAAEAKPAARSEPRPASPPKSAAAPAKPAQPSDLEKEMASLLGGSGKT